MRKDQITPGTIYSDGKGGYRLVLDCGEHLQPTYRHNEARDTYVSYIGSRAYISQVGAPDESVVTLTTFASWAKETTTLAPFPILIQLGLARPRYTTVPFEGRWAVMDGDKRLRNTYERELTAARKATRLNFNANLVDVAEYLIPMDQRMAAVSTAPGAEVPDMDKAGSRLAPTLEATP